MNQLILAIAIFLACIVSTEAATYYVAKTGDDSHPCTEAQPCLTVGHGVTLLTPGDTLFVRAGVYAERLVNVIPAGTSWDAPVRVSAMPISGEGYQAVYEPVTLQPEAASGTMLTNIVEMRGGTHAYIILEGMHLDITSNISHGI